MKMKKVLALVLCAVLLVAGSVMGTLAYLTSTTGPVTNTMTVGNVQITLDEAPVNEYGEVVDGDRVTENEYKLIPGHNYDKDPTVHVAVGSEPCYVFVEVVNGLAAIEDETTIAAQMAAKGWAPVDGVANVYIHTGEVDAREATSPVDLIVFEEFTIKGNADVAAYEDATITITAYAIQADGFENSTPAEIWAALKG